MFTNIKIIKNHIDELKVIHTNIENYYRKLLLSRNIV